MNASTNSIITGNHEPASVEELIRYAHHRLTATGEALSAAKVTKVVRRLHRRNPVLAQGAIDAYVDGQSRTGFELFVLGYADPTGAAAAQNLDNSGAAQLIRARREAVAHV